MEYIAESDGPGKKRRKQRRLNKKRNRGKKNVQMGRKTCLTCPDTDSLDMAAYGGTLGFDPNNLKSSNFRKH